MGFTTQGRPYTKVDIESLTENQIGVYGIFNASRWIYVGKGDIRVNMLKHLNGDNACINRQMPTGWKAELNPNPTLREKELILELKPICNERVG